MPCCSSCSVWRPSGPLLVLLFLSPPHHGHWMALTSALLLSSPGGETCPTGGQSEVSEYTWGMNRFGCEGIKNNLKNKPKNLLSHNLNKLDWGGV